MKPHSVHAYRRLLMPLAVFHLSAGAAPAAEVALTVNADQQVTEYNNTPQNTGNGTGTQINARFSAVQNEAIGLRFDLTGYDRSQITSASLNLINHRANTARILHYWGVNNGARGRDATQVPPLDGPVDDNDWLESSGTRFSDMPGLEYDALPGTQGLIAERVTDLGSQTMNNAAEGSVCSFNAQSLVDFLKSHADSLVTILITVDTVSTGQSRFASKETTVLQSGGAAQPAGTFAPRLVLEITNNSVDRDNDGLLNHWETTYGFNPDLADSDGDAIPDGVEDGDGDGLQNSGEQARGTNPGDADTDDDTLSDNAESATGIWVSLTNTGTSPLLADSDLDSLPDSIENPDLPFVDASQPGTNPNKADSDGDLYTDPAELARGSNPKLASSVPDGAVLTIVGTGTVSLPGSDLTDPDGNIDNSTPGGANFNWLSATATTKPFFGTGVQQDPTSMGAFDLFDNKLGPVNDKWCCDGPPVSVTLEFPGTVSLTHFTVSSPDDGPQRDPVDWQILGSNDGVIFTPIFTQTDPLRLAIFTARLQVIRCQLSAASPGYRYIRYECTRAASGQHALGELELFGTLTPDSLSGFDIVGVVRNAQTGAIRLTWRSHPGETYRIESSSNLQSFPVTVTEDIPAAAGSTTTQEFADPIPGGSRAFLRVVNQ